MKRLASLTLGLSFFIASGLATWLFLEVNHSPIASVQSTPNAATPEQIARGEYLARIGNCAGCHTARGGEPYAGGKAVDTPFGAGYASNLTPDTTTGIGTWSADAFYRAEKWLRKTEQWNKWKLWASRWTEDGLASRS